MGRCWGREAGAEMGWGVMGSGLGMRWDGLVQPPITPQAPPSACPHPDCMRPLPPAPIQIACAHPDCMRPSRLHASRLPAGSHARQKILRIQPNLDTWTEGWMKTARGGNGMTQLEVKRIRWDGKGMEGKGGGREEKRWKGWDGPGWA